MCQRARFDEGRIGKREFQIDLEAGTVTCPEGHVVAIPQQARRDGERMVNFGAPPLQRLPAEAALQHPTRASRKLTIARREDLLQAGRTNVCRTPTPKNTYDAPDRESNASSECSPTTTARARTGTSAAPKDGYRPTGPPRWSTSTRSAIAWLPRRDRAGLERPDRPSEASTPSPPRPSWCDSRWPRPADPPNRATEAYGCRPRQTTSSAPTSRTSLAVCRSSCGCRELVRDGGLRTGESWGQSGGS